MFCSDFVGNTTPYSRKPASHVRPTKLHSAFKWPHVLILSMKSCGSLPLLHTIHTQHQALAPSAPILLAVKFEFFKAEFCRRHSAKAWQEKSGGQSSSWSNLTLGRFSPPFLLANFSGCSTKGWGMDGFGMKCVSFNLTFSHICSLTALERYLPNQNPMQTAASLTTTKQPVKNQHASIDLQHWDQQRSTLQCFPFRAREHFTDFTFKWLCLGPSSMPFFGDPTHLGHHQEKLT